jgi:dTDP-4-amino-4,6-dideoxygalactose transaminase
VKYKIPFIKPDFPESKEILEDYELILKNNWFTNFGPFENRLCSLVTNYIGQDVYATTVANATLGLFIATKELFAKDPKKNKVLMPSFTFAAGAEALIWSNLEPVFIDINQEDLQPDIVQASGYIQKNKKNIAGILLCNIFGVGNTEIDRWENLSSEYNIPLIIDSAAGFGSEYFIGEKIGARGDCEIFSLHATKPFSVGEGGIITSKNKKLIENFRSLENFGFGSDRNVHYIGMNAKLEEMNAAIGIRQIKKLDERIHKRRQLMMVYIDGLKDYDFGFQANCEISTIPFATITAKDNMQANKLYETLHENGVEARRYYNPPLHTQKIIMNYASLSGTIKVTEDISGRVLSLPVHDTMEQKDINFVIELVIKSL